MKQRKGPTKKLAPMISPDSCCPHAFSEDDGIQLEMDCSQCAGAQDLENNKCLAGIVNVISFGAMPETIILKRFIHKRYRGRLVSIATSASTELSALKRASASAERTSDKKCRTCAASMEQIISYLRRRLMAEPLLYVSSPDSIADDLEHDSRSHACAQARECISKGLSCSTLIRSA